MSVRARALLVALVAVLLVGVTLAALRAPAPRAAAGWPAPEELDSLTRYLEPVPPAPRIDEYAEYLPAALPDRVAPPPTARRGPEPTWRLSAILITRNRPIAIIDDQQVRPGERLADGAEVVSIERDHVIVRAADGTRRTLRVAPAVNE